MSLLHFFFGKKFSVNKDNIPVQAGAVYLDTEKHELWYDNPDSSDSSNLRHQIIDTTALTYSVDKTFESFTPDNSEGGGATSAKLGVAVLGSMVLGEG